MPTHAIGARIVAAGLAPADTQNDHKKIASLAGMSLQIVMRQIKVDMTTLFGDQGDERYSSNNQYLSCKGSMPLPILN
ncbi:hypothetical protein KKE26_00080 [bacterium]|nr:hypothetical protein [bacterium]